LSRSLIIGVLAVALAALAGCSALRLGYSQAPQLVYWWLDRYAAFDESQSPRVHELIRAWFRWHRSTQLGDYAALLARTQAAMTGPVTPAQVCRLYDDVEALLTTAFDQAVPAVVEMSRTLKPEQFAHMQKRYAKADREYRDDFLQDATEERFRAQTKRIVERAEMLYGRLDEVQRERIAQQVTESPFDPRAWSGERRRRQQDTLQTLRRLASEAVPQDEAEAVVRRLYEQMWRSPRADYRAYQDRLEQYNCDFAAQVHNQTTAEQRRRAIARLKGWEDDLRALTGGA
jgi:hypothetical protein